MASRVELHVNGELVAEISEDQAHIAQDSLSTTFETENGPITIEGRIGQHWSGIGGQIWVNGDFLSGNRSFLYLSDAERNQPFISRMTPIFWRCALPCFGTGGAVSAAIFAMLLLPVDARMLIFPFALILGGISAIFIAVLAAWLLQPNA